MKTCSLQPCLFLVRFDQVVVVHRGGQIKFCLSLPLHVLIEVSNDL